MRAAEVPSARPASPERSARLGSHTLVIRVELLLQPLHLLLVAQEGLVLSERARLLLLLLLQDLPHQRVLVIIGDAWGHKAALPGTKVALPTAMGTAARQPTSALLIRLSLLA